MSSRVLLVDSSPELRETIASVLRRECFEVEDALDGEAALAAAVRGPIDVVLLDLHLRKLSGMDVLRKLRAFSAPSVFALGARDSDVDGVRALELGAHVCVTVPCSLAELVSRVRALLRRCDY